MFVLQLYTTCNRTRSRHFSWCGANALHDSLARSRINDILLLDRSVWIRKIIIDIEFRTKLTESPEQPSGQGRTAIEGALEVSTPPNKLSTCLVRRDGFPVGPELI